MSQICFTEEDIEKLAKSLAKVVEDYENALTNAYQYGSDKTIHSFTELFAASKVCQSAFTTTLNQIIKSKTDV
jgi:hypothetical protein